MNSALPAGPPIPRLIQLLGTWTRPTAFLERCRARYGKRFTLRFPLQPPFVVLSDPDEIKQVFTAPPDVLHPGEGAILLEPIVGANSVILLDEAPHLEQRKLMLPAFHGERMERLRGLVRELAEREIDSWPTGEEVELHPRLQQLTLEIILRAVFGLEQGERLESLRDVLTAGLRFTESPLSLIPLKPGTIERFALGDGPVARMMHLTEQADVLVYELIEERRRSAEAERNDVLAMLLEAQHEDGSPMSAQELRDELMTALVAGHETTASQLAWAFAELSHEPAIESQVAREAIAGEDDVYLTATINEVMRRRPVLPNAEPRLVKKPVRIGEVEYPAGVVLIANAYLVHHDPAIYPDPYVLRPERFLESQPGTYTWLPFGGGRRRCLGASFAQLEMKVVLGAALSRYALRPASVQRELPRRRSITISPSRGARVIFERRPSTPQEGADAQASRQHAAGANSSPAARVPVGSGA
jgi:cytochrome P450